MKIGCVVMASGLSERFGSNKLLAQFGGKPLIAHTLGHLPLDCLERVVVVSAYKEVALLAKQAGLSHVAPQGPGINDTIRAGIMQMQGMDGCMFCAGDQPLCKESTLRRLIEGFAAQPESIARLYSGVIPGSPVIFPAQLFDELKTLPENKGGSLLVQKYPERLSAVQVDDPWELDDADTPEKLLSLGKYLEALRQDE